MDVRQMNCFLVLAEELHFGRAAERLHMSQPPLSRTIGQMERELGVRLFDRTKRAVMLTPAGLALLSDARQIVLQMQTVQKRLRIFGKGETGTVRIGYVGAVMHAGLPGKLAQFASAHPNIQLQFEELSNESLVHGLHHGTLDAAFVRTWLRVEDLTEHLLAEETFVAVLPGNHRLAKKRKISAADLKDESFITFTRECGPTLFDAFLVICSRAGFAPHITHHASQLNSVLRLVESGFGVSLLPAHTQKGYDLDVVYKPLLDAGETVPLLMLTRKADSNPALLRLRKHITKE